MKHKSVLIAFLFCIHTASAQNEWTLQPLVEVFGTVNGRELGKFVTGLDPQTGFPFRAGVSEVGKTGIYRLQSTSDTSIQTFFSGEQLLQRRRTWLKHQATNSKSQINSKSSRAESSAKFNCSKADVAWAVAHLVLD